jgi:hypothetical protein
MTVALCLIVGAIFGFAAGTLFCAVSLTVATGPRAVKLVRSVGINRGSETYEVVVSASDSTGGL